MNIKDTKYSVRKMAQGVFFIWKELGETPLQALERLREGEGIDADVPMTYAGRLDPLAEGELLVLIGDECKKKEEYLGLDKEYEVEILLGISSDTGDVLGIIESGLAGEPGESWSISEISRVLGKFIGKVSWPYPAFSSKTVQGKPLFLWSLEGKIGEIDIPVRESEIYELELLSAPSTKLSSIELRDEVHKKINSIKLVPDGAESKRLGADFRREEVLGSWATFFNCPKCPRGPLGHEIIKIRCKCSSGTYMRTLAQKVGDELGTHALALSIVRTQIMLE